MTFRSCSDSSEVPFKRYCTYLLSVYIKNSWSTISFMCLSCTYKCIHTLCMCDFKIRKKWWYKSQAGCKLRSIYGDVHLQFLLLMMAYLASKHVKLKEYFIPFNNTRFLFMSVGINVGAYFRINVQYNLPVCTTIYLSMNCGVICACT